MSIHYFQVQARNNAWANFRLLSACEQLTREAFEAKRVGFFPSLKATLNHILIVDWLYVDALEGGRLGYKASENEEPCATLEDLIKEQSSVDRRLIAHCDALREGDLSKSVELVRIDGIRTERRDRVLLHLLQHQIHHRGQAHAMLAETEVSPPQLDEFFLHQDVGLRSADLASLGWREDELWENFR